METATEKAHNGMKWEKISKIEPSGSKPALCIAVSGASRLYITNDCIVTHNTAGDPRNPLPEAYVDRNGRIKVLATVPEENRKGAALTALPLAQLPPDAAAIYAPAPADLRASASRLSDEMLARAGYLGSQEAPRYPAEQLTGDLPINIQGGKAKLLSERVYSRIIYAMAKFSPRVADLFLGTGAVSNYISKAGLKKRGQIAVEFDPVRWNYFKRISDPKTRGAVKAAARKAISELAATQNGAVDSISKSTTVESASEEFARFLSAVEMPKSQYLEGVKRKSIDGYKNAISKLSGTHEFVGNKMAHFARVYSLQAHVSAWQYSLVPEGYDLKAHGSKLAKSHKSADDIKHGQGDLLAGTEMGFISPPSLPALKHTNESAGFIIAASMITDRSIDFDVREDGQIKWISGLREKENYFDTQKAREIESVIEKYGSRLEGIKFLNKDSFHLAKKLSKQVKGIGLVYDPAYFGKIDPETGEAKGTANYTSLTEIQTPQDLLDVVDKYILPAWKNGARIVLTNEYDEATANALRERGFNVEQSFRTGGNAELVASNFSPETGAINALSESRRSYVQLRRELRPRSVTGGNNSADNETAQPAAGKPAEKGDGGNDVSALGGLQFVEQQTGPEPGGITPPNILPPGTTPIPIGDAMPKDPGQVFTQAEWDSYDKDLGKKFTQQPLNLESQAAQIYRQIGEDEASYKFPYPPPTSKPLEEIAKAYAGEDVRINDAGHGIQVIIFGNGQGMALMPGENGNYQVNAEGTNGKRLTGNMGALGYQIAGTWAHNNGFKITSFGEISQMNVLRRTSNMISNILRHDGETRQWRPNPDQQVAWTQGDNEGNLQSLLKREAQIVLEKIPSLRSIFTDGKNIFARTPKGERPIPASRLLSSLAARFGKADGIGEATIRRALLTRSINDEVLRGRIQENLAIPAGTQAGRNDDAGSGSPAFTTGRLLYSQSAYDHVTALAQRAYQETQAGGARTVGDPKRAYSMENEQWMGLDEYRKLNFQAQKESDWLKLAEKMLATDYVGTMRGLLAKFQASESLLPWETKAAEKVIAAEMAKPLYGGPEQNARREVLYRLVLGLRESRASTARTLAAMRDPHRSPEERLRAFAGDVIFTPSAATMKKASKFITEAEKDRRIAALESRLDALKPLAEKSQKQHAEIASLQKQLAETNRMGTQEQVIQQDLDERYDRVKARLRELGVTIEDLMGGTVEVRLLGAEILGQIAQGFTPEERQMIDFAGGMKKGGATIADIARRMNVTRERIIEVNNRYDDALMADLMKKTKLKAMTKDNLLIKGVDDAVIKTLNSSPKQEEVSDFVAEEKALEIFRMLGRIRMSEYDRTIVRSKLTKKVKATPAPNQKVVMEPWSGPKPGEGKPLEVLLEEARKKGLVWKDAPTGEGKPVDEMLKPTTPEWQRPTGEGKTTDTGRLDLDEGPWEHTRFNFDDAAQRLQAMRLIQSAAHGATGWDYASEILVANLLSAPTTAVTNITGYLYGVYRFTIRRAIEAAMNFGGSSEAATFGEFRPMMSALSRNLGTAFANAIAAWQTETPITEALRNNSQQKLGMQFDEPLGKIPGKFGRIVRMPMRFLLATDEFAKTILAHTHAATVAHRLGRAQGFDGKRLASFINGQLGDPTSVVWEKALQEARHVTFQDKLRTFTEMDAQEMGAFDRIINSPEGIAAQLMRYKNAAGPDAGLIHNIAAFGLRAVFPFIKTPLNLLKIGIHESFLGGILEAMRTGGGVGVRARQKNKQTGEWQYGAKDMGAAVNARAAILTSAIITAILAAAGEGDDDDDSKWLLFTGTTPQKDQKAQGLRELRNRTIPEQTIVFRIGGVTFMFSYRRLDPFATWIATTVDTLSSIKQAKKGKSGWEAVTRFNNSLMSQVLEKASLRGFSQVAGLILGGKPPTTQDVLNTAAAWTVPNAIRNPARNSDPLLRDTDFIAGDVAAQLKYAVLPTADNAPPARLDLYGKPIEQRGNFFTRTFIPGQPASVNAFAKEDVTLTNWNLQNPAAPFAPETPDTKAIIKRYNITPATADRFMRARGEYIATQMRANGLSGLKRPTADQIDQIEKIVGKSKDAARKRVLGK